MKIILNPEGDLRKAIQRISKNSKLSTHDVALMLLENGLIRFTGTMAQLEIDEKKKNKWYMKLFRRNK